MFDLSWVDLFIFLKLTYRHMYFVSISELFQCQNAANSWEIHLPTGFLVVNFAWLLQSTVSLSWEAENLKSSCCGYFYDVIENSAAHAVMYKQRRHTSACERIHPPDPFMLSYTPTALVTSKTRSGSKKQKSKTNDNHKAKSLVKGCYNTTTRLSKDQSTLCVR